MKVAEPAAKRTRRRTSKSVTRSWASTTTQQLTKRVKRGSSPYAYAVAEFDTKVADNDENSLIPNLQLMKDGFEKLKAALQVARNNYNEQEESVGQHLGKLVPPDEAS